MKSSVISMAVLLFLVMDPVGNVPLFLAILRPLPPRRRARVILRESLIGLGVLALFLLVGRQALALLQVSMSSLSLAGGVILFLIALSMVFKGGDTLIQGESGTDPLIVPLAVPLIAGPSAISTVMLVAGRAPGHPGAPLVALALAWSAGTVLLLASGALYRLLGDKVLQACERLMGLLLAMISVEMVTAGLRALLAAGRGPG